LLANVAVGSTDAPVATIDRIDVPRDHPLQRININNHAVNRDLIEQAANQGLPGRALGRRATRSLTTR